MKFREFMNLLSKDANLDLIFQFDHRPIRKEYHITEVLSYQVNAVDCGSQKSQWHETVIQLIEPGSDIPEGQHMSATKALAIFEKSAELLGIESDSQVILEYRPEHTNAAQRYEVSEVITQDGKVIVFTAGATTQCKPALRSEEITTCCSSQSTTSKNQCCDSRSASVRKTATACCA
jgi:hypothetical protein